MREWEEVKRNRCIEVEGEEEVNVRKGETQTERKNTACSMKQA